jgi:hypothetical protein
MNKDRTSNRRDTDLTRERSLRVLAADLRRLRPHLPPEAQGHASNLIEQIGNFLKGGPRQQEALKPFMRKSMERLETTRRAGHQ